MPVFRLSSQLRFPPPCVAESNGLLALGGDLSPQRLLLAYSMGIFPWYGEQDPILWWSPDPRCILEPGFLHVSKSLAKLLRRGLLRVTYDQAFPEVLKACAAVRVEAGEGTWLSPTMMEAYGGLHELGYAHSVECWEEGSLVGGLYGVSLGHCFFGESMFHRRSDASKVALTTLARILFARGFELIDCQFSTPHLCSLGAREIPRDEFMRRLVGAKVFTSPQPAPGWFPVGGGGSVLGGD